MILTYPIDPFQIIGYCILGLISGFLLYRKFKLIDTILITFTTIISFQMFWEWLNNIIFYGINGLLIPTLLLKYIFLFAPTILWFYYALKYGKKSMLLIFVFTNYISAIFTIFPNISNIILNEIPFFIRYMWIIAYLINIYFFTSFYIRKGVK